MSTTPATSEFDLPTPFLSLVIATVSRVAELERCLKSIAGTLSGGVEVVLVDQNEDDRLATVVERASQFLPLVWLRWEQRHAGNARNLGALRARGVWIGFPDDDCHFLPNTFEQLGLRIASERFDIISGMTCDEYGAPTVLRWLEREAPMTQANLRSSFAESTFYVRRNLFLSVSGFDPGFGPGSLFAAEEGIDLVRRLWKAQPGLRAVFSPSICFVHADSCAYVDEEALVKTKRYAQARGASFARHWRTASPVRIANEILRHAVGSVVLCGLRRRSRYLTLMGYVEGFVGYHAAQKREARAKDPLKSEETLSVSLTVKG